RSVVAHRARRQAEARQERSGRGRLQSRVGSPSKHARADVADPDRDRQRDIGLVLNEEIKRLRRAVAFGSRLLAEASDAPFNLPRDVLNRVRRAAFHMVDQACDIALQRVQVLAKQCEIRFHLHRCVHGAYVSRRRKGSGYGDARVTMVEASPHGKTRKLLTPPALFPIFDGEAEAKLIALACGPAPAGRAKWTLRLLEEKVVELQIVESA